MYLFHGIPLLIFTFVPPPPYNASPLLSSFTFSKFSIFPIFLIFSHFLFSKFPHTSNFPDIFQVPIFHISHTSGFSDILQLHILNISHTPSFPNIFLFHVFRSSNFIDIFPFSFSILSIFPIPTFLLTLSHIQIVSLLYPLIPYFIAP